MNYKKHGKILGKIMCLEGDARSKPKITKDTIGIIKAKTFDVAITLN